MKEAQQPRILYFDYLRILAMFAVMLLHVASQFWYTTPTNTAEWQACNIYDSLARFGVPIFVMISGALFLGKKRPIKRIYQKNILRLLVAMFFWSILYALWQKYIAHAFDSNIAFLKEVLVGHVHLWFVYMIIGLYMISPMLQKLVEDRKLAIYFVTLSIAFAFLIPEIIKVIGLVSPGISSILQAMRDALKLDFVLSYSGLFVLGHLLHTAKIDCKKEKWLYILGVASVLFTMIATAFVSIKRNTPVPIFYDTFTINVLLQSISVFVFFKKHVNKPAKSEKVGHLIANISKYSFGAYLVHLFVLYTFDIFLHFNSFSFNPFIAIPVIAVIIFMISVSVSAIIHKIPVARDWIV